MQSTAAWRARQSAPAPTDGGRTQRARCAPRPARQHHRRARVSRTPDSGPRRAEHRAAQARNGPSWTVDIIVGFNNTARAAERSAVSVVTARAPARRKRRISDAGRSRAPHQRPSSLESPAHLRWRQKPTDPTQTPPSARALSGAVSRRASAITRAASRTGPGADPSCRHPVLATELARSPRGDLAPPAESIANRIATGVRLPDRRAATGTRPRRWCKDFGAARWGDAD